MGGRLDRLTLEARSESGLGGSLHDPLSSVSRLVGERLAAAPPIEGFETRRVRAALLLTDVVDFSAYVDRVSASGPAALEALARDFDSYLSELIGIVYRCGGDVLSINKHIAPADTRSSSGASGGGAVAGRTITSGAVQRRGGAVERCVEADHAERVRTAGDQRRATEFGWSRQPRDVRHHGGACRPFGVAPPGE